MNDAIEWEVYVPVRGRKPSSTPFVSARGSDLFLNKTAMEMLGNPRELTILIDKRKRRIGFRVPVGDGPRFPMRADRRIRANGLFIELPGIGGKRIPLSMRDGGILASEPID